MHCACRRILAVAGWCLAGMLLLRFGVGADETGKGGAAATTTTAPATTSPATTRASSAAPAPEPSPEVAAKIAAVIKDLSSDSWKDRQAAQEKLVTFGEDAVGALRRLVARAKDEEVRNRAGAALRQIEENSQVGASTITIKVKDAKPQDVFAQLAKQARTEFTTQPGNMWAMRGYPAITMDLERVNFWTAFKEACMKAGVSPMPWGQQRGIQLHPHGGNVQWHGPTAYSGPFMIVANQITKSSTVSLANAQNVQRDFYIQLTAFVEPKVRVLQSSHQVKVDEAVDDKGNNLARAERFFGGGSSGNQWMWSLSARLTWPENMGTRLAKFKGSVAFVVQTKADTLDVPEVAKVKNLTKVVAGRRILIKELKQNGSQYELHATMYRDGTNSNEWNTMDHSLNYTMRLLDNQGRALTSQGWHTGGGNNERTYQWTFGREALGPNNERTGEPYRFVWEIPVETREVRAGFEFKDLPLPN